MSRPCSQRLRALAGAMHETYRVRSAHQNVRMVRKAHPIKMAQLNIEPNLSHFDEFYEALIDAHRELTTEQSHQLNAKLVLLLANHIGDLDVLKAAMQRAKP